MPLGEYEIVAGFNDSAGAVNVETVAGIRYSPRSNRLPLGGTTRIMLSGERKTDGAQWVDWTFGAMLQSELDSLVTAVWTSWDIENADVTINTRLRDGTYDYKNAIAHLPRANEEYILRPDNVRENVVIRFYVIGDAT